MTEEFPDWSISAVAREIGLSVDVLRKWESRYGFPAPHRDANDERVYPASQVDRLRQIKRLMDSGLRPARLIKEDEAGLALLQLRQRQAPEAAVNLDATLMRVRSQDPYTLYEYFQGKLLRQGLSAFIGQTVIPLTVAMGEVWMQGDLPVHEEHLYTQALGSVLRSAIVSVGGSTAKGRPRVLLTTLPEERHELGLLTVAAILALDGAQCLLLGCETPMQDIAAAASTHAADIVGLSFSSRYPMRPIAATLERLSVQLGSKTEIWVGGAGAARLNATPNGVRVLLTAHAALDALARWRGVHTGSGVQPD